LRPYKRCRRAVGGVKIQRAPLVFVTVAYKGVRFTVGMGPRRDWAFLARSWIGSLGEKDAMNCAPTKDADARWAVSRFNGHPLFL
jgi:hypothetical protein